MTESPVWRVLSLTISNREIDPYIFRVLVFLIISIRSAVSIRLQISRQQDLRNIDINYQNVRGGRGLSICHLLLGQCTDHLDDQNLEHTILIYWYSP